MKMVASILLFVLVINLNAQQYKTNLIIIGGGKSISLAEKAKENYLKHPELTKQIKSDVKILLSDTIKGLNPGFYIAVIGYCTDTYKAHLLANFANKYITGVYVRSVFVNRKIESPVFMPVKSPFSGKEYSVMHKAFADFFNDEYETSAIPISYSNKKVIVETNKVVFEKQKGLVRLKYYVGWLKDTHRIVYLNQFQFSNMFDNSPAWRFECEETVTDAEIGEFDYQITEETCIYSNGVEKESENGYESSVESFVFPLDKFSFDEVLNYYVGKAYFNWVFRLKPDMFNNGKYYDEENTINYYFLPDKKIWFDEPGSWISLEIKNKEIVFTDGGGA